MSAPTFSARAMALWLVQGSLGLVFTGTGLWKLVTPTAALAAIFPWMGEVPKAFLVMTALVDLAGGLGLILPTLTRVAPRLSVLAALGCAALQGAAVVFHIARGEARDTPFNFALVALCLLVAFQRNRAP